MTHRWSPFDALAPGWRVCLEEAWKAYVAGSLPIGAAVVDAQGTVLSRGRNRLGEDGGEACADGAPSYLAGVPLAHAEVNALLALHGREPEPGWTLFTTTEPCPMCMGATRMTDMPHLRFASRDGWAGSTVMAEVVPYLQRRGPTVAGPEPGLEPALLAWQTERHFAWHGGEPPFLSTWRAMDPFACDVGAALYQDDALRALARNDAGVEAAWRLLGERLAVNA